jgi:hypothetical protein
MAIVFAPATPEGRVLKPHAPMSESHAARVAGPAIKRVTGAEFTGHGRLLPEQVQAISAEMENQMRFANDARIVLRAHELRLVCLEAAKRGLGVSWS